MKNEIRHCEKCGKVLAPSYIDPGTLCRVCANQRPPEGPAGHEAAIFLEAMLSGRCTCEVRRLESGEIVLPDLAKCAWTIDAHREAIELAVASLKRL